MNARRLLAEKLSPRQYLDRDDHADTRTDSMWGRFWYTPAVAGLLSGQPNYSSVGGRSLRAGSSTDYL